MDRSGEFIGKWIGFILDYILCNIFGLCPNCISRSPKIYDCIVCKYDTDYPANKEKKKLWWGKYLKVIESYKLIKKFRNDPARRCCYFIKENDIVKLYSHPFSFTGSDHNIVLEMMDIAIQEDFMFWMDSKQGAEYVKENKEQLIKEWGNQITDFIL